MAVLNMLLEMLLMVCALFLHELKVPFTSRGGVFKIVLIVLSLLLIEDSVVSVASPSITSSVTYSKDYKPTFKSNTFKPNK